jgi:hypothetical protein
VPTAFTSLTLPCFTPGTVGSLPPGPGAGADVAGGVDEASGVEDAAGVVGAGGGPAGLAAGWLLGGVFCPYPARAGANSNPLATMISAGISFLRSNLLIAIPFVLAVSLERFHDYFVRSGLSKVGLFLVKRPV